MFRFFVYAVAYLIVSEIGVARCQDYTDYDYGDPAYHYDMVHKTQESIVAKGGVPGLEPPAPPLAVRGVAGVSSVENPTLPLCCKIGEVFDSGKCMIPELKLTWKPKLSGYMNARFAYRGFPKCKSQKNYINFYQKEIHFNHQEGSALLPFYIQIKSVMPKNYCIAKVIEEDHTCEDFQTQIFACIKEDEGTLDIVWASLTISHLLLFLTLMVFIFMADLRCLQGQLMICFIISILIYNICLLPLSHVAINVGDIMCIALGAVKYFFFCGIFLWFNIICFDVWRTIKNRQDVSNRKRFLFYSIYCWLTAAVFTIVVLVLPYTKDGSSGNTRLDPLREANYEGCKLKMGVDLILQMAQTLSMIASFIFMVLASVSFYGYKRFGNGLARHEASLCLKQSWKLCLMMVAHMISSIDHQFMKLPIEMYQYVLLESVTIFGIYAYRKAVIRWVLKGACFTRWMKPKAADDGNSQEKGQLTLT